MLGKILFIDHENRYFTNNLDKKASCFYMVIANLH